MALLAAANDFPYEIILVVVAAIIAILNKVAEASRSMRKKSLEDRRTREDTGGVQLEEEAPPRERKAEVEPELPEFRIPIPLPRTLAPKPVITRVEAPRRPRPARPRLQLGTEAAPRPKPVGPRRSTPMPRRRPVAKPAPPRMHVNLRDPRHLREAIVLREILGTPLALRRLRRW